jgi:prolipoprotein diacylglyceryltransferase
VITFDFDPFLHIGDMAVRWQTVALAFVIFAGLVLAARIAGRVSDGQGGRLRRDDLLYIVVGAVPGAVVGGRLGYALLHLDYFAAHPGLLLDPAAGDLELGAGVAFGTLTGAYLVRLLDAPIRRWLHVAALPCLFMLGAGKLTMVLSGAGQGEPSSAAWATRYTGSGPWLSLGPGISSHPSQAYEGLASLTILLILVAVLASGGFRNRDGRLFTAALAAWALIRLLVATTWRDPPLAGPLRADQIISLAILVASLVCHLAISRWPAGIHFGTNGHGSDSAPEPDWPDPVVTSNWRGSVHGTTDRD